MVVRRIVQIDQEKCNGCGLCIPACHEGAIEIVDGKARVIDDKFCDGLGDCLAECPQGAITIIEREAAEYDEEAVKKRIKKREASRNSNTHHSGGCPGARMMDISKSSPDNYDEDSGLEIKIKSQLKQWPVQLMLVPEEAPYFEDAELLVTADCVPFAYPDFHLDLLRGRVVVTGCPKLDNYGYYLDKLTGILKKNNLKGISVTFMEVPCCTGIVRIIEEAIDRSGKSIPLRKIRISMSGEKTIIK